MPFVFDYFSIICSDIIHSRSHALRGNEMKSSKNMTICHIFKPPEKYQIELIYKLKITNGLKEAIWMR